MIIKTPPSIVGYNIETNTTNVYLESSKKMGYSFLDQTKDHIFIVGNYTGGAYESDINDYFVHILMFNNDMNLVKDFRVPTKQNEYFDSSCYVENKIYFSFRKINYGIGPLNMKIKIHTIGLDLETEKIDGGITGSSALASFHHGVFYLKENSYYMLNDNMLKDLYCYTKNESKMFMEKITEYTILGDYFTVIAKINDAYCVKIINFVTNTQTEVFTKCNCTFSNVSASIDIVDFDIFNINGCRTFDKLTVFYHISKKEYRIMNGDFLSQSIINMVFYKVINNYYYGENTEYSDSNSSAISSIICRSDLSDLFSSK